MLSSILFRRLLDTIQGMSEKGIDQLRADLAAVDADCAEQIRKTVHDNYHHFIQACQVVALHWACNDSLRRASLKKLRSTVAESNPAPI